MNINQSEIITF